MTKKILGLIGCGYWGKNLIREFNSIDVLHTICDNNPDVLKGYNEKYPDVNTTNNWDDVLNNPDITCVCVSLPVELHYEFTKKSLLAGKDVFVEKPITFHLHEAEELIKIAETNNKILMVGHILHYHPAVVKIKQMLEEDKIGKIKTIVANRFNLGIIRKYENVLWSFAPHDISLILNFIGATPNTVFCSGMDYINKGVHDITNSVLYFDNTYVNLNVNWLNPYKEQKMSIIGEKGMLLFDDVSKDKLTFYPEYVEYSSDINCVPTPIKNNGENIELDLSKSPLLCECEHFISCCKTRSRPVTDGKDGFNVLKVLYKLQESLDLQKLLSFKDKINYFKHDTAIIDSGAKIGSGTNIWHNSHICSGAIIGKNCNIGQNVFIASGAIIGDNCKVQNNVSIYKGVIAKDNVFFGPSCVLTNDINPRCSYPKNGEYIKTYIETGATLGANCTIVCGSKIGKHSLVGAGAVICKDVEDYSIVVGNPGRNIGNIDEYGNRTIN